MSLYRKQSFQTPDGKDLPTNLDQANAYILSGGLGGHEMLCFVLALIRV
jgi:hypothetical protein